MLVPVDERRPAFAAVVGIDAHKSSLCAAAVDELGRTLGVSQFPNSRRGHQELSRWVAAHGCVQIGIECSGTFGAAAARLLRSEGRVVVEVPAGLSHREARRHPAKGKSDPSDAVAIARVVARGEGLTPSGRTQSCEDLRLLCDLHDQLNQQRTQLINRIHRDLVILAPGYESRIVSLNRATALARAMRVLHGDRSLRAELTRERVAEVRRLEGKLKQVRARLEQELRSSGTTLTALPGVGTRLAARILGEVGDVTAFRSAAAFAQFCGVAPVPASSGSTVRHRFNRGGNRKLNHVLHYMAIVQLRVYPPARAFFDKKRAEGKSSKEAIRCLKRHLANAVYRTMVNDTRALAEAA